MNSRAPCFTAAPSVVPAPSVIPAKAGIQGSHLRAKRLPRLSMPWIPASAGMTGRLQVRRPWTPAFARMTRLSQVRQPAAPFATQTELAHVRR